MTQPTMRLLLTSLMTMALAACGGADRPAGQSPADTCAYEGKIYRVGETFPDRDGCNTCYCAPEGETCTAMRCDGAPPPSDADTCEYDGQTYHTGDTFPATDGCNTCACNPEGNRGVGCSMKACDPCSACGPDEVCVQYFDGMCLTGGAGCTKVSAACRDGICSPECEKELCGEGPYQCALQVPCGTEEGATINCYGP